MIPKFRIFDKKKKRFLDDFAMEIDRDGINVLDEFNYVVDEDDRVLMQSTGLHDKNGKEIFEGDIIGSEDINAHDWKVSLHQIVKRDCGLVGKQICSNGSYIGIEHWTTGKNPFVVVGNIHEHPGLLKENGE